MRLHHVIPALLLLALPARAADMSNNCRVDIRFVTSGGNVYAIVEVDAVWGALIDGDMRLVVNGQQIKVEPVLTDNQYIDSTNLGSATQTFSACATVEGRNWITSENWLLAQTTDCTYRSGEAGNAAPILRQPTAPRSAATRLIAVPR